MQPSAFDLHPIRPHHCHYRVSQRIKAKRVTMTSRSLETLPNLLEYFEHWHSIRQWFWLRRRSYLSSSCLWQPTCQWSLLSNLLVSRRLMGWGTVQLYRPGHSLAILIQSRGGKVTELTNHRARQNTKVSPKHGFQQGNLPLVIKAYHKHRHHRRTEFHVSSDSIALNILQPSAISPAIKLTPPSKMARSIIWWHKASSGALKSALPHPKNKAWKGAWKLVFHGFPIFLDFLDKWMNCNNSPIFTNSNPWPTLDTLNPKHQSKAVATWGRFDLCTYCICSSPFLPPLYIYILDTYIYIYVYVYIYVCVCVDLCIYIYMCVCV